MTAACLELLRPAGGLRALAAIVLLLAASGCAPGRLTTQDANLRAAPQFAQLPVVEDTVGTGPVAPEDVDLVPIERPNDPIEPINRAIFRFNDALDTYVFRPVVRTYRTIVPRPLRENLTNVLRNMREPVIFANEVMQGDWHGAERSVTRFFLNSTVGLGGLIDIAGMDKGLQFESEDFGQTLGVWGVPEGPYVVLPILGPSNARDTVGIVVDSMIDPISAVTGGIQEFGYARTGATILDLKERTVDPLQELKESSIDFYAAVRSAYHQTRVAAINDGNSAAPVVDIPVYDDFDRTQ